MFNKNIHIQSCMATRLPSWAYLGLCIVFLAHTVNVFLSEFIPFYVCLELAEDHLGSCEVCHRPGQGPIQQ